MGAQAVQGQRLEATEAAAGAAVVLADRSFWGGELGIARRPGQSRFALSVAGGSYDGHAGIRLSAAAQFLLKPAERRGTSPYAGLGIAFVGGYEMSGSGYLTAQLGLETAPGRGGGWYGELGLAGGVRFAVGRRWRRFPAWWK